MTISEREELFKKKLLVGLKKSYKSRQPVNGPRISLMSAIGKSVIRNCDGKCQVSGARYNDPYKFAIHHIDGNRTNNQISNLTLLRADYHQTIHGQINVIFKKYTEKYPIIPRPKSKPKPKISAKSEFGEVNVLERWRLADQQAQDSWKKSVDASLKSLGYSF